MFDEYLLSIIFSYIHPNDVPRFRMISKDSNLFVSKTLWKIIPRYAYSMHLGNHDSEFLVRTLGRRLNDKEQKKVMLLIFSMSPKRFRVLYQNLSIDDFILICPIIQDEPGALSLIACLKEMSADHVIKTHKIFMNASDKAYNIFLKKYVPDEIDRLLFKHSM